MRLPGNPFLLRQACPILPRPPAEGLCRESQAGPALPALSGGPQDPLERVPSPRLRSWIQPIPLRRHTRPPCALLACQVLARHRSSPSCCPWDLPGRPRLSAYLQEQWGHSAAPGDSDRGSAWWARVPQRRWTPKSVNCHPAPSLLASGASLCPTGLPPAPQSSSAPPWAASRLCTLSRASSGPRRRGPSVGLEP